MWEPIADDLLARAVQLHSGKRKPLEHVLRLAGAAANDIESLVAVAVTSARQREESWAEVGRSAGVSAASARARWGGDQVPRLLERRAGSPSGTVGAVESLLNSASPPTWPELEKALLALGADAVTLERLRVTARADEAVVEQKDNEG
ncbi:hypothetical protein ACGFRB_29040 [Streptomyces sp. NPDC048718]|uniref:hypothetical protein n=1 Tax=Streptomyces sp. NPDC048718 TaxID=3365587 RepID=UPI00371BAE5E